MRKRAPKAPHSKSPRPHKGPAKQPKKPKY